MNKKVLLIPVAIGLLIFIVFQITKKETTGNNFEMTIPNSAVLKSGDSGLKSITMYLDNSGSMKGYLDFASMPNGNEANATFISTLSNFMDNAKKTYDIDPKCFCGGKEYDRQSFLKEMQNFKIFNGAQTLLHNEITELADNTSDSSVVVFASDMVLSYGKQTLNAKGKYYNKQQLDQLGAYVHNAMTNVHGRNNELQVLLLQYYGDFNGRYYYNYTENIEPNIYRDTLMRNRPFFLFAIGKKEYLIGMMETPVFPKPVHVYATFDMPANRTQQKFTIEMDNNAVAWIIGNPDPQYADQPGTIMTNAEFGDAVSTLRISYPRFETPAFINVQENGKLVPVWDTGVINSVTIESDAKAPRQNLIVELNPHKRLSTTTGVKIQLCSYNGWIDAATTDDDTKESDISGKTWGLSTIVNNINKVYRSNEQLEPETVAELKFDIIIN